MEFAFRGNTTTIPRFIIFLSFSILFLLLLIDGQVEAAPTHHHEEGEHQVGKALKPETTALQANKPGANLIHSSRKTPAIKTQIKSIQRLADANNNKIVPTEKQENASRRNDKNSSLASDEEFSDEGKEEFYDIPDRSPSSQYNSAENCFGAAENRQQLKGQPKHELAHFCMANHRVEKKENDKAEAGKNGNKNVAAAAAAALEATTTTATPVPFEWVDSAVSINYVQPVRILQLAELTLMLGVKKQSSGAYCVRLHGFGTVPHIFSTFELKWEKPEASGRGGFSAKANAEWQIRRGGVMWIFPMKVVAKVLAQKMVNAVRHRTITSWDGLARFLALGLIKEKPQTAGKWAANASLEQQQSDELTNGGDNGGGGKGEKEEAVSQNQLDSSNDGTMMVEDMKNPEKLNVVGTTTQNNKN